MTEMNDWNAKTIAEFRANEGRVGGAFEGAPITLVHHRGRKSGREYVSPMMYLADDGEPGPSMSSRQRPAPPPILTGTTTSSPQAWATWRWGRKPTQCA